ncbi:hypothetical protein AAZX31_05G116800 [Glycine max]|nr:hypothetical protein JHK87_012708 [Glycine soja]KHN25870.1 hypothetical protein glysoja_018724 [Glycine soja]
MAAAIQISSAWAFAKRNGQRITDMEFSILSFAILGRHTGSWICIFNRFKVRVWGKWQWGFGIAKLGVDVRGRTRCIRELGKAWGGDDEQQGGVLRMWEGELLDCFDDFRSSTTLIIVW